MVAIKETVLNHFDNGGYAYPIKPGQFETANGLHFDNGRPIVTPAWSTAATITIGEDNYLDHVYGAFANPLSTQPVVWLGREGNNFTAVYGYPSGTPYTTHTIISNDYISGQMGQNFIFTDNNYLFLIAQGPCTYRGHYTGTLSGVSCADGHILVAWNDTIYLLSNANTILIWNGSAISPTLTPDISTRPLFAVPFRGYLLITSMRADGTIILYQLTLADDLRVLYQFSNANYTTGTTNILEGHAYALHNGDLYFTDRTYVTTENGDIAINVYRWDGGEVKLIERLSIDSAAPVSTGLVAWQNKLVFYALREGTSPTHNFYTLVGDHFVPLNSITDTGAVADVSLDQIGDQLIFNRLVATVATYNVLGPGPVTAASYYGNATLETGRLDFNTGQQKLLHSIIVKLSSDDHAVTVKYRVDNTESSTSWTTATTGTSNRIAATDIEQHFYTLQIRVEVTAAAQTTTPYEIESISIIYTRP